MRGTRARDAGDLGDADLKRVGVVGARGHVGAELVPLLAGHPGVELAWVTSSSAPGTAVPSTNLVYSAPNRADLAPVDVTFLALPNGESKNWIGDNVVIDLSADHRFDDTFVYAQIERFRSRIRGARRLACPGCYATAAQLAIAPIGDWLAAAPHVFGVSGYSGAGTTPSEKNDPAVLKDNLLPYSLTGHLHERELTRHLGRDVFFMPHVASFFRGLSVTASCVLDREIEVEALEAHFRNYYAGESFVEIQKEAPRPRDLANTHRVAVGGFAVRGHHVVVVAALDNLLAGAASQAIRAMNLALELPEAQGLS